MKERSSLDGSSRPHEIVSTAAPRDCNSSLDQQSLMHTSSLKQTQNSNNGSRTNSLFGNNSGGGKPTVIIKEEFVALDPSEIEIFVVKPVKKIVALLSHVVSILSSL
jgi:hypothetical protein